MIADYLSCAHWTAYNIRNTKRTRETTSYSTKFAANTKQESPFEVPKPSLAQKSLAKMHFIDHVKSY